MADGNVLNSDARRYFLLGMRVFFGVWLLYGGVVKWLVFGPLGFVEMITGIFDKTWSPHAMNVALAWFIMEMEVLLPLLILTGWRPRISWTLASLLMFLLLFGQSMTMEHDVTVNWVLTVLTLACAALSDPEGRKNGGMA